MSLRFITSWESNSEVPIFGQVIQITKRNTHVGLRIPTTAYSPSVFYLFLVLFNGSLHIHTLVDWVPDGASDGKLKS